MSTEQQTTSTEVAVTESGSALVLESDQSFWSSKQLAALRQLGVDKASNADLAVYFHVSQRTGLDPFARQIYMVRRDGKQVIQTGIDGYRLIARRAVDASGETLSIAAPEWCDADGNWSDVWLADGYPAAARVKVYRDGQAFGAVALWREYVQTVKDGDTVRVTRMWDTRPAGQLAKCAEALALRKAFPLDLSGIYVDAELDKAGVVKGEVVRRRGRGLQNALDEQRAAAQGEEPVDVEVVEDADTEAAEQTGEES